MVACCLVAQLESDFLVYHVFWREECHVISKHGFQLKGQLYGETLYACQFLRQEACVYYYHVFMLLWSLAMSFNYLRKTRCALSPSFIIALRFYMGGHEIIYHLSCLLSLRCPKNQKTRTSHQACGIARTPRHKACSSSISFRDWSFG